MIYKIIKHSKVFKKKTLQIKVSEAAHHQWETHTALLGTRLPHLQSAKTRWFRRKLGSETSPSLGKKN